MDLTPYIATLRDDLTTAASAGDEQTRRTAAVLAAALEPAARLAIMNALSDLAAEVTAALEDRVVELRLDGRDVRVAVSGDPVEPAAPPPPLGQDLGGDVSRITLRLLEEIKTKAEQAAASQGVSLNAWLSQAVQGALYGNAAREWSEHRGDRHGGHQGGPHGGRHGGRRMRGWVQG